MAKRRPSGDGMVRKREDGRWEGRIVVGHKQNGEPIFRYVLAKTQKELLDKLHRDLEAFQDVELTEDSRMTLGEWLDRWMEDYGAATLRPNTLRSYEQFIRCYIKPYLGDKIVSLASFTAGFQLGLGIAGELTPYSFEDDEEERALRRQEQKEP